MLIFSVLFCNGNFHIERFKKVDSVWENQRVGDQSYILTETSQGIC